jgi:hypothetical protein
MPNSTPDPSSERTTAALPLPYAVEIPEALRLLGGMSRAWLYVALGRGELEAIKDGRRIKITTASIEARQRALPRAAIKPSR